MIRSNIAKKIAWRKRPALEDPSHKVCQGGKGSVWDGQTYGQTDGHIQSTSGPLPVYFRFTSGTFGHHGWSYEASQL